MVQPLSQITYDFKFFIMLYMCSFIHSVLNRCTVDALLHACKCMHVREQESFLQKGLDASQVRDS